jgi:predicted RNA binding protein YcfA (HicA-like mRNA interferase family)
MKSVSGRELARVLERESWVLLRVQGSHHIYGKEGSVVRLSVPVHGDRDLNSGLLHFLMRTAGLSEDDLYR